MCSPSECRRVVDEAIKQLGGIDIVISNAVRNYPYKTCMPHGPLLALTITPGVDTLQQLCRPRFHVRRRMGQSTSPLFPLPFHFYSPASTYVLMPHQQCWSANVKAPLALLKAAKPTFEANPEGGVFISTGSIAAVSQAGSSMPYSVTKAAQLHLIKCLGATQGPKIRVNTVLPGLLLTEWVCFPTMPWFSPGERPGNEVLC